MKLTPTNKLVILTSLAVVPFTTMSLMLLPADVIAGSAIIAALVSIAAVELKSSSITKYIRCNAVKHEC